MNHRSETPLFRYLLASVFLSIALVVAAIAQPGLFGGETEVGRAVDAAPPPAADLMVPLSDSTTTTIPGEASSSSTGGMETSSTGGSSSTTDELESSTSSSTLPSTSSSTLAPSTTTTRPTTTTTRPTTTSTTKPSTTSTTSAPQPPGPPGGSFGAGPVGPAQEPASTSGIVHSGSGHVQAIQGASSGQTVLLRAGNYSGGFHIPNGVTVKPYNREAVTINGQISMGSNSTIAGLTLTSNSQWVIRVGASGTVSNVTIRHNKITGGTIEGVRISSGGRDALIEGNEITGGGNHNVKVISENNNAKPTATIRGNVIKDPVREDDVQTEFAGVVLIERNTFGRAPEQNVDIKRGDQVIIRRNDFAVSGREGPLLVTGTALVENNIFRGGPAIQMGCCKSGDPSWTFRSNIVQNHEIWLLQSTKPVIFEGNTVSGGSLQIGHSNNWPRDARILSNTFNGTQLLDRTQPSGSFICTGNSVSGGSGAWSNCK